MRSGALWNTFIMAGPARRFWDLARKHLPVHSSLLDSYRQIAGTENASEYLSGIYSFLAPADFSRDVLENANQLGVVALEPCGWSDWGTPERVLRSLEGTNVAAELLAKLKNGVPVEAARPFARTRAMTELVEA
jgi:hypothetical protein